MLCRQLTVGGPGAHAAASASRTAPSSRKWYRLVPLCALALATDVRFALDVDWSSGSRTTSLPTANFSTRKTTFLVWPGDGRTYAYADIVAFDNFYYPDSYDTEVGAFSSDDGVGGWRYHGIVVPRGAAGEWDAGGVASPGAAVAPDGSVLVGYAAEPRDGGAGNRGIGIARAPHPLGPFVKSATPVASPNSTCGGTGRCDDVIIHSAMGADRGKNGTMHLYHSLKGSSSVPGCSPPDAHNCIRHLTSTDAGASWDQLGPVLSSPGIMETIGGTFFPNLGGGQDPSDRGRMVLLVDGGSDHTLPNGGLVAYGAGDMHNFSEMVPFAVSAHPPVRHSPGSWANIQMDFVPDGAGGVPRVAFALYTNQSVFSQHHKVMDRGYATTLFNVTVRALNTTWMNNTNLHSGDNATADFELPVGTGDEGAARCAARCAAIGAYCGAWVFVRAAPAGDGPRCAIKQRAGFSAPDAGFACCIAGESESETF